MWSKNPSSRRLESVLVFAAIAALAAAFVLSDLPFTLRRAFGVLAGLGTIGIALWAHYRRGEANTFSRGAAMVASGSAVLAVAISFLSD